MVLDESVRAFDEPFADDSVIPSYYISQLAQRHVTVALTKLGGARAFGGYERHLGIAMSDRLDRLTPGPARRLAAELTKWIPDQFGQHNTVDHLKRFASAWSLDGQSRYLSYFSVFSASERARLLIIPQAHSRETHDLSGRPVRIFCPGR